MNLLKKVVNAVVNSEENKKLKSWQSKYDSAKSKYSNELSDMTEHENYYDGDRRVKVNPNRGDAYSSKMSMNVRNICYELIETEVDSSIPMPKVTPIHEEDVEQARKIEDFIKNEIKILDIKTLNDLQERITPVQGGSYTLVEWDNTKGYHCTLGDLDVSNIHPRQLIPQPGVSEIKKMDYLFIRTSQTKDYIKRRFKKDVSNEDETDMEIRDDTASDDIVTVVTCYYKNDKGGIGLFRWCGDTVLEEYDDYQARQLKVCSKCGTVKGDSDTCETCGSKKFKLSEDEYEPVKLMSETQSGIDEQGNPIITKEELYVDVPYYKPQEFPVILRKNISKDKKLLGVSDIEIISDQQETIKKLGSKATEKVLKGGSFLTLPQGVGVDTTDEELKIIRLNTPNEIQMIQVLTLQADTSRDMSIIEMNYSWAKSALGITDAYQGKYDSSATSGIAKQYSINRAAGRLESKRVMKNQSYAHLYEMMFKFALSCADQPIPINIEGKDGETKFSHFDRMDFLKQDSAGEYYWNDEFIFDTDPTSTLLTNREAMWNQADLKLQSGAFGTLGDLETNYLYWLEQERNGYPNAGEIKRVIEQRLSEQKQMQSQEVSQNEMSQM